MKMADKIKETRGNEILVIECWEKDTEGYIFVGGNNTNI